MSTGTIILLTGIVAVGLMVGVSLLVLRRVSSALHPLPRHYALGLVEPIYELLAATELNEKHFLLSLSPTRRERVALAWVVASLSHKVVECNPLLVRRLSQVWQLEEALVWRIARSTGRRRTEALGWLLWLYPSAESVRRVTRATFRTPSAALAQLLLVLYLSPERVVELLSRHPFALSWEEIGDVVEVLKMYSPTLAPLDIPEGISPNVDVLLLRMAAVEGVGDASELARRFAQSDSVILRHAAMNVLLEESLFAAVGQTEMGG